MLNPTILFDIHNQKFTPETGRRKRRQSLYRVDAQNSTQADHKIGVWINTKTNIVEKVTSFGKDGNDVVITIKSLKKPEKELDVHLLPF